MSEYMTLDEFFPDGKPDGRKFWAQGWSSPLFYFVPFYKAKCIDGTLSWFGKDVNGRHVEMDTEDLFKEYVEPKKNGTKYLWASPKGVICTGFARDLNELTSHFYHGHDISNYIRLDWSATEFDDE